MVGSHEAGQRIRVGELAEDGVSTVHGGIDHPAVAFQDLVLIDAALGVNAVQVGHFLVDLAAIQNSVPHAVEVFHGSLIGSVVPNHRPGAVDFDACLLQRSLDTTCHGLLDFTGNLEEEVSEDVPNLSSEVTQHRQVAPVVELLGKRGGHLVRDILLNLSEQEVAFCIRFGIAICVYQCRVQLDFVLLSPSSRVEALFLFRLGPVVVIQLVHRFLDTVQTPLGG